MLWEGWIDARYIAAHTDGFEALKATRARLHAEARPRASAASRGDDLVAGGALVRATRGRATLSLYCQGLNQRTQRHDEERRADQPAPGDRPDRQARRRPVLADRPAERDGRARGRRHGQPAVGAPRPRRTPRIAPRSRALWGVADVPAQRRARPRSRCSRPPPTARSRRSGSPARTRRSRCPTRRRCARALERAEFVVVQEAFADDRDLRLRRPAAAGDDLGREGRHRHQQRAAHQPRARRGAPRRRGARTTGRSPPTSRAASSARLRPRRAARCSPYADAPRRSGTSTARSTRGRDLDITGLELRAARARARSSGRVREGARAGPRAPLRRRRLRRPPTAARASSTRRTRRRPSRATRAIRSRSTPAACATSGTA